MIQILEGKSLVYNTDGKRSVLLTQKDGPQDLGVELEAELIEAGVAKPVQSPTDKGHGDTKNLSKTSSSKEDTPNDDRPDMPYSIKMKADKLRTLLNENGLNFRPGMSKTDMVALLDEYFAASKDDEEQPPNLHAEEPLP